MLTARPEWRGKPARACPTDKDDALCCIRKAGVLRAHPAPLRPPHSAQVQKTSIQCHQLNVATPRIHANLTSGDRSPFGSEKLYGAIGLSDEEKAASDGNDGDADASKPANWTSNASGNASSSTSGNPNPSSTNTAANINSFGTTIATNNNSPANSNVPRSPSNSQLQSQSTQNNLQKNLQNANANNSPLKTGPPGSPGASAPGDQGGEQGGESEAKLKPKPVVIEMVEQTSAMFQPLSALLFPGSEDGDNHIQAIGSPKGVKKGNQKAKSDKKNRKNIQIVKASDSSLDPKSLNGSSNYVPSSSEILEFPDLLFCAKVLHTLLQKLQPILRSLRKTSRLLIESNIACVLEALLLLESREAELLKRRKEEVDSFVRDLKDCVEEMKASSGENEENARNEFGQFWDEVAKGIVASGGVGGMRSAKGEESAGGIEGESPNEM